ncbi:MAG TPA: Slp family lipoprotein [Nitrospiraceae bacterium]|nr:Slp family lipoprotein [Nitrospiraceae bacterium]
MIRFGNRKSGRLACAAVLSVGMILLQACATIPTFSPRVMEDLDETFDVEAWWKAPNSMVGRKVELGGQLVQGVVKNGETFLVVLQLPIVDQLIYESFETHKPMKQYGIHYRATIDPKWLAAGNHIMVVGATLQTKTVLVSGTQQTIPFVNAECLHVWKSAGTAPPSLPLDTAAKFERLEQATYCTSGY